MVPVWDDVRRRPYGTLGSQALARQITRDQRSLDALARAKATADRQAAERAVGAV